jgi:hypothetical protein
MLVQRDGITADQALDVLTDESTDRDQSLVVVAEELTGTRHPWAPSPGWGLRRGPDRAVDVDPPTPAHQFVDGEPLLTSGGELATLAGTCGAGSSWGG